MGVKKGPSFSRHKSVENTGLFRDRIGVKKGVPFLTVTQRIEVGEYRLSPARPIAGHVVLGVPKRHRVAKGIGQAWGNVTTVKR